MEMYIGYIVRNNIKMKKNIMKQIIPKQWNKYKKHFQVFVFSYFNQILTLVQI